jgi:hypothetical protein
LGLIPSFAFLLMLLFSSLFFPASRFRIGDRARFLSGDGAGGYEMFFLF